MACSNASRGSFDGTAATSKHCKLQAFVVGVPSIFELWYENIILTFHTYFVTWMQC